MTEDERARELRACVANYANFVMEIHFLLQTGKVETAMNRIDAVRSSNGCLLGWKKELGNPIP